MEQVGVLLGESGDLLFEVFLLGLEVFELFEMLGFQEPGVGSALR